MSFTVVITSGALAEETRFIPEDINMEFAEEQAMDALIYFVNSVRYFEDAIKWDPNYYGLGFIAHLWHGNRVICKTRIS